jgi:hypothetical protein
MRPGLRKDGREAAVGVVEAAVAGEAGAAAAVATAGSSFHFMK